MQKLLSDLRAHLNEAEGLLSKMMDESTAINSQAAKAVPVAKEVAEREKRVADLKAEEANLRESVKALQAEFAALRSKYQ